MIKINVNGKDFVTERNPLTRLIDVLREDLLLTGTKEGCSEGECGACAVFLDGKVVNSCLIPIGAIDGCSVTTIEGYVETAPGRVLSQAFLDEGAVQCGYCIPGMIMSSDALLRETHGKPTESDVRHGLAGNLCRCTGYDHIVSAVLKASEVSSKNEGGSLW